MPTNIITEDGDAGGLITSYNQLVLDRNRILKSATTENPSVIKLDQQISSLKANVATSLKRMQSNLQIQNRDLKNQEGILNNKIGKIGTGTSVQSNCQTTKSKRRTVFIFVAKA